MQKIHEYSTLYSLVKENLMEFTEEKFEQVIHEQISDTKIKPNKGPSGKETLMLS